MYRAINILPPLFYDPPLYPIREKTIRVEIKELRCA